MRYEAVVSSYNELQFGSAGLFGPECAVMQLTRATRLLPPHRTWQAPAVDLSAQSCPCTRDGVSGGVNTTKIGCGQWLVYDGSNEFVCYVDDASGCNANELTPSSLYIGASYRACPASTASLPTLADLLSSTSAAMMFFSAVQTSRLTGLPGNKVTAFAPINSAMAAIPLDQLTDPAYMRVLVLNSLASGAMSVETLSEAGSVQTAAGSRYSARNATFENGT